MRFFVEDLVTSRQIATTIGKSLTRSSACGGGILSYMTIFLAKVAVIAMKQSFSKFL